MLKKSVWFGLLCIAAAVLSSCNNNGSSKKINLEKREVPQKSAERQTDKPLRIAVGGMITPKEGFVYYREFIDYIGEKLNRPVEFIDREKYDEINMLMKAGQIDVAFVCSGPYVDGHDEFGMELLAAPQAYRKTVYYAYIIVAKDSPIDSFEALRGKTFAFADPLSNTGKIVPEYMLAKMNETPGTFFKKSIYTYAHDTSIKAVAQGVVDGASVDSLIWEYTNRTNPGLTAKTKIIETSPPYAVPPVAVRKGLGPAMKRKLRGILLNADHDERGKELLGKMMIEKFVVIDDSAYNSVREMKSWIARHKEREETR
jgi:phosphonate transport system substrate-binding protein